MGEAGLKAQWTTAQIAIVRAGNLAPIFEGITDQALGMLLVLVRGFAEMLPLKVDLQAKVDHILWLYACGHLRIVGLPDGDMHLVHAHPATVAKQRPILTAAGIQRPSQQALEAELETP